MRRSTVLIVATLSSLAMVVGLTGAVSAHPTDEDSGKAAGFDYEMEAVSPGGVPQVRMSGEKCVDGYAGIFPCSNIDLMSLTPMPALRSLYLNDIWGWTDPLTRREYAIIGAFEGTIFVDVTNGQAPVYLGLLPAVDTGDFFNIWGDIRTYENYAYIVSETANNGMQVFDLTRLRGVNRPQRWTADNHITDFGNAHNISLNEDTGHAVVVGSWDFVHPLGCDNGGGGPMFFDLSDPGNPALAGCFADDGYTHDIQCVRYHGPDVEYRLDQICVASNEDTVTVLNASDPANVELISRVGYGTAGYTHQGWLTEDHSYFLLGDEVDELAGFVTERTTYIWDMTDLDNPTLVSAFSDGGTSIDHNIFINEGLAYESNYTDGLWVYNTRPAATGELGLVGYFDVYPASGDPIFAGTWGNYPFLESGKVIVSSSEEGLFVLDVGDPARESAE